MLMNNLDPDVAEDPENLVVYGGTGRAVAVMGSLRCDLRGRLSVSPTMRPCSFNRANRSACSAPTSGRHAFCSPTPTSCPEWANWTEFRRLESLGLTMYGQMTAGSWIYIGTQGILQGTYECFAEIARRRFGGSLAGTITLTAGLGGMGGAQPLAITMNDGVALCIDVDADRVTRRIEPSLSRRGRRIARRCGGSLPRGARRSSGAFRRGRRKRRHAVTGARRGRLSSRHRHRPDERPRPAVVRAGGPHPGGRSAVGPPTNPTSWSAEPVSRWRPIRAAMVAYADKGPRCSTTATACGRRRRSVDSTERSTIPGSCPPTSARCSARARDRFAGSPCRAILPTLPRPTAPCSTNFPTTPPCTGGSVSPPSGLRSKACRHGSAGSAMASAIVSGCVSTRWFVAASVGADRHRSGPSRLRFGGVAVSRDRGDGRWFRCDRRLATAQRPRQHGERSELGEHPSRWRRRHRPLDPRRDGVCRRRHRARCCKARTSAHL